MKKCIIVIFCLLIIPVFTFAEEDCGQLTDEG